MQTVIYYGNLTEQSKALAITFPDACEMVFGLKKSLRLTVDDAVDLRRRLGDGEVLATKGGGQVWMEEK